MSFRNERLDPILQPWGDLGEHVWVAGETVDADYGIPRVIIILVERSHFYSKINLPPASG